MKKILFVAVALAAMIASASRFDGIVKGEGEPIEEYRAPIISNGELCISVDQNCAARSKYVRASYRPGIYWQARRCGLPRFPHIVQGEFAMHVNVDGKDFTSAPKWEQELDVKKAVIHCRNEYDGGVKIDASVFVPFEENVIVFKQVVKNTSAQVRKVSVAMEYAKSDSKYVVGNWADTAKSGYLQYEWRNFGRYVWDSRMRLVARGDGEAKVVKLSDKAYALEKDFELKPGEGKTVEWMMHYVDTLEDEMCKMKVFTAFDHNEQRPKTNLGDESKRVMNDFAKRGFDGYFKAHCEAWAAYYAESKIEFPEEDLQRLADMAQYHLRANATKWSFPVGMQNSHWSGRFFGFDEMYCHHGLISANHIDVAKRCPLYRKATLEPAVKRNRHYNYKGVYGARWVWESEESGAVEGSSIGFWLDHIFHMSNIAKSSWLQYLYSGDKKYLAETGYPVMLECARYFKNCVTYTDSNGDTYIGKFTDLERLGSAIDHPFMTTCGAIYSMETVAAAADILGIDKEEAEGFRKTATALRKYLPKKDGRYIAYNGCKDESVATLSGYFPYPVIPSTDPSQRAAVKHFFENGRSVGNMYPTGTKVCPWYAGWMSTAAFYMEDREEAYRWIKEAFTVSGLFGEYFEINEKEIRKCPWFSTAAGTCLFALNQFYVCDADGETRVAYLVPENWKDYAFKLPCQKGVLIDCEVKGGKLEKLNLSLQTLGEAREVILVLKPEIAKQIDVKNAAIKKVETFAEKVKLAVCVDDAGVTLAK